MEKRRNAPTGEEAIPELELAIQQALDAAHGAPWLPC